MMLVVIAKTRYEVCAITGADEVEAVALEFLVGAPPNMRASARGMFQLFERYAALGRQGLTSPLFHEAGADGRIWEFVKGQLRVYCFKDDNGLVILTHGAVKRTQVTAKADLDRAMRMRDSYLTAKAQGRLTREEWRSDDR
jgi:phage-related protein